MSFIVFLIILVAADWYIFWSVGSMYKDTQGNWKFWLSIIYWSITVGFLGFLLYNFATNGRSIHNSPLVFVRSFFYVIYLCKTLFLLLLLIDDFRRLIVELIRRLFKVAFFPAPARKGLLSKIGFFSSLAAFILFMYGQLMNPYRYKFYRKKIKINNLPDALKGLKILQISDIHAGSFFFDAPLRRAVEMINRESPDLVFFTGDLVNATTAEVLPFIDALSNIKARYGVFSVLGNHDYGDYHRTWNSEADKAANLRAMEEAHQKMGWKLLRNQNQSLNINGTPLVIIGVDNKSAYNRFPNYGDLQVATQGLAPKDFKLLLSHDPSHWDLEVNKAFKDIAVTFSGHTHGCQFGIEIPGFIKWSPIKIMYQQWGGLYEKSGQYLYVNRGLGYVGYAGRVGILPEISVLSLA